MPLGEMSLGGSLLDDLQVHTLKRTCLTLGTSFILYTVYMYRENGLCVVYLHSVCVCLGSQCGPCMSAGASTAGIFFVASHPWRGDSAHTSSALDGPTGQSGIFPSRTQLLGQVITISIYQETKG